MSEDAIHRNPTSRTRRDDVITSLLTDRIDAVQKHAEKIESGLDRHIEFCAKLQKWQLAGISLTLGWIVAHSPEAAKLAKLVLDTL